jgi:putative addiction module killer protein
MEKRYRLVYYVDSVSGRTPALEWLNGLKDKSIRLSIRSRLVRIENGNLGDVKSLGDGVFEFRIFIGAGYRLYFAIEGREVILLLMGGDKSTQFQDIRRAKIFLENYNSSRKS